MAMNLLTEPSIQGRGARTKQLRRHLLRMTVQEFAELCGTTIWIVYHWERGSIGGLSHKSAERVVVALDHTPVTCSLEWLLEGEVEMPHVRPNES